MSEDQLIDLVRKTVQHWAIEEAEESTEKVTSVIGG